MESCEAIDRTCPLSWLFLTCPSEFEPFESLKTAETSRPQRGFSELCHRYCAKLPLSEAFENDNSRCRGLRAEGPSGSMSRFECAKEKTQKIIWRIVKILKSKRITAEWIRMTNNDKCIRSYIPKPVDALAALASIYAPPPSLARESQELRSCALWNLRQTADCSDSPMACSWHRSLVQGYESPQMIDINHAAAKCVETCRMM